MSAPSPRGILRRGWSASVDDYAIAGGWTRDGKTLVVGDAAGGVYGFDGTSGKTIWEEREVHDGGLIAMMIHPDAASFATAGQDGRVLIWNANEGRVSEAIELGAGWAENVAWSPDGQWLAASISRRVHVLDAKGSEVWCSEDHPSTVSAVAWASREELATACYGRVAFFDGSTGQLGQELKWKGSLVSMVLSPDGDIVACGSQDNSVHFWRRSTAQDSMMSGYPGKPSALAFGAAGTLLATGGGRAVTVWSFRGNGPEGTRPGVLELHSDSVTALSFAARRSRLASGARDGSVVVWTLEPDGNGEPVGVALLEPPVSVLRWRPDGRSLAALDARGGVTVWRVSK